MKKVLFTVGLLIMSFAFIACDDDDDKVISVDNLPTNVQAFLQTHFASQEVRMVEKDNDSYDVYLINGFEIEFTLSGEWDDIDGRGQQIPASIVALIPTNIPTYITTNYPNQFIVEINKEHFGYEIDLNNNLELEFDTEGNFLRID
ncbi:MAG: PepSY-like domain-containing protein [Dysgonomonas sp.]